MRRRATSPLLLETDVGERLSVGVADDEALGMLSNTEGGGKLHAS